MADELLEETLAREIANIIREAIAPLRNGLETLEAKEREGSCPG
jgi:hypothetical protein